MATKTAQSIAVGDTFRTLIMDSNPLFEIIEIRGERVTAEAVPEPIEFDGKVFPGDHDGMVKDFLRSDVVRMVARARSMESFFAEANRQQEEFWASVEEGQVLHFHNSHKRWVRGVAVKGEDGAMGFRSTALVGEWGAVDLPQRRANGEVYHPYHAAKIANGEVWTPRVDSIFESGHESAVRNGSPVDFPEIDLALPEPTEEEAAEQADARLLDKISGAINDYTSSPSERLSAIRDLLSA